MGDELAIDAFIIYHLCMHININASTATLTNGGRCWWLKLM